MKFKMLACLVGVLLPHNTMIIINSLKINSVKCIVRKIFFTIFAE